MKTSCDSVWSDNHTESQEVYLLCFIYITLCKKEKTLQVILFNLMFKQVDKVFNFRAAVFPVNNAPYQNNTAGHKPIWHYPPRFLLKAHGWNRDGR